MHHLFTHLSPVFHVSAPGTRPGVTMELIDMRTHSVYTHALDFTANTHTHTAQTAAHNAHRSPSTPRQRWMACHRYYCVYSTTFIAGGWMVTEHNGVFRVGQWCRQLLLRSLCVVVCVWFGGFGSGNAPCMLGLGVFPNTSNIGTNYMHITYKTCVRAIAREFKCVVFRLCETYGSSMVGTVYTYIEVDMHIL